MNKNFPQYNQTRRTADKGVTLIKLITETQFDWIFRPTHLEDDFGLDGYLDIIGNDNSVTGKYLGVQIKTGESYFKNKKKFGWTFNGENKHLNYYLNSNFPVIITLVNLEIQKAYWVKFDINKISKTKNGWSIIVPETNLFDINSKMEFQKLVGNIIDYMSQVEYQWELNETLKKSDFTYLNVNKEEIIAKDISGFTTFVDKLTIDDEIIRKARGTFTFFIDGYNDDTRELFEIEEVRQWIKLLIPAVKYWGYFLNMEDFIHSFTGLRVLHFCSVDIKVLGTIK